MIQYCIFYEKNSNRDGNSTALYAAFTVDTDDMVYTVDMFYTVEMVYTVETTNTFDTANTVGTVEMLTLLTLYTIQTTLHRLTSRMYAYYIGKVRMLLVWGDALLNI